MCREQQPVYRPARRRGRMCKWSCLFIRMCEIRDTWDTQRVIPRVCSHSFDHFPVTSEIDRRGWNGHKRALCVCAINQKSVLALQTERKSILVCSAQASVCMTALMPCPHLCLAPLAFVVWMCLSTCMQMFVETVCVCTHVRVKRYDGA